MIALLDLPKEGSEIFTIERCKIEKYYVISIKFHRKPDFQANKDLSQDIEVELERYNDKVNSFRTTKRLSDCFTTKKELIEQLEK